MADVTGPISSLPGSLHIVPKGTMCDDHPDRPAVRRVQGETDSMGSEMHDMCQECCDAEKTATDDSGGVCDWCNQQVAKLCHTRDHDEGLYGPVYLVCDDCLEKRRDVDDEEYDDVFLDVDDD